ncbi:hypothetical protein Tco_0017019 [Tanacetum coccineum]
MAQFWHTLKEDGSKYRLKFMLDKKELSLTLDDVRTIFHLPQANDNNHNSSVPPPSFSDMVLFYKHELGFTMELKTSSIFKTTGLLQPWQTLCKIFLKCLTTRVTRWDQPPLQIMQMMYCFINNIHVDYAELLWEGLYYSLYYPTSSIPKTQRQSWNADTSLDDLRRNEAHGALSDVCGGPEPFLTLNEPICPRFVVEFYHSLEVKRNEELQTLYTTKWSLNSLDDHLNSNFFGPKHDLVKKAITTPRTTQAQLLRDPNKLYTYDIRPDLKGWELFFKENFFCSIDKRNKVKACTAYMLYYLEESSTSLR